MFSNFQPHMVHPVFTKFQSAIIFLIFGRSQKSNSLYSPMTTIFIIVFDTNLMEPLEEAAF